MNTQTKKPATPQGVAIDGELLQAISQLVMAAITVIKLLTRK